LIEQVFALREFLFGSLSLGDVLAEGGDTDVDAVLKDGIQGDLKPTATGDLIFGAECAM